MFFMRFILLFLSILQFVSETVFWQTNFYWFFIWIIAFQLNWFHIEKTKYKNNILGTLCVLALINVAILPQFPVLMLGLLTIDVRQHFNRNQTLIIVSGLIAISMLLWMFVTSWPTSFEILLALAVMSLGGWSADQDMELKEFKRERYHQLMTQTKLKQKTDLLKAQMNSMQEVYTLNERNRISRDLHDSVGHTLSTIVIQLAAIAKLTENSNPQASSMLHQLHLFTKEGLTNVRKAIHELKPANYQQVAFIEQIANLIQQFETNSQIQVHFNYNENRWKLTESQETMIYRSIQEFIGNSSKHSEATEIRIQYHFTDSVLILTMTDNGKGTDQIKPEMGLTGMKERVKLLGGKFNVQSANGSGFKVRIVLPKGGFVSDSNTV